MSDPVKLPLSSPLTTHDGSLSELTLKEPPASIVFKHGLPWKQVVRVDGSAFEIEYLPRKMSLYLEEMSGVDQISLSAMKACDAISAFEAIFHILRPAKN
jgi:hypothetical protein